MIRALRAKRPDSREMLCPCLEREPLARGSEMWSEQYYCKNIFGRNGVTRNTEIRASKIKKERGSERDGSRDREIRRGSWENQIGVKSQGLAPNPNSMKTHNTRHFGLHTLVVLIKNMCSKRRLITLIILGCSEENLPPLKSSPPIVKA